MAIGDYEKTIYVNGQAPAINAANLNKNENKTDELDKALETHLKDNTAHVPHLGTTTNSGNNYSITNNKSISANSKFSVSFNAAATGTATLNISSIGTAKPLKKPGGGDFKPKVGPYTFFYDGSNFIVLGEGGEYGTATPADVYTGVEFGTEDGLKVGTNPYKSGSIINVLDLDSIESPLFCPIISQSTSGHRWAIGKNHIAVGGKVYEIVSPLNLVDTGITYESTDSNKYIEVELSEDTLYVYDSRPSQTTGWLRAYRLSDGVQIGSMSFTETSPLNSDVYLHHDGTALYLIFGGSSISDFRTKRIKSDLSAVDWSYANFISRMGYYVPRDNTGFIFVMEGSKIKKVNKSNGQVAATSTVDMDYGVELEYDPYDNTLYVLERIFNIVDGTYQACIRKLNSSLAQSWEATPIPPLGSSYNYRMIALRNYLLVVTYSSSSTRFRLINKTSGTLAFSGQSFSIGNFLSWKYFDLGRNKFLFNMGGCVGLGYLNLKLK